MAERVGQLTGRRAVYQQINDEPRAADGGRRARRRAEAPVDDIAPNLSLRLRRGGQLGN